MISPRRILIAGGPRVGKTTFAEKLARELGVTPLHTDDLIGTLAWSDASEHVSQWLEAPGPFVIEGVTLVRALRKWLARHDVGLPADVLYIGETPKVACTPQQVAMGKSFATIWFQIADALRLRGLTAQTF